MLLSELTLFKNGRIVDHITGAVTKSVLVDKLQKMIANPKPETIKV